MVISCLILLSCRIKTENKGGNQDLVVELKQNRIGFKLGLGLDEFTTTTCTPYQSSILLDPLLPWIEPGWNTSEKKVPLLICVLGLGFLVWRLFLCRVCEITGPSPFWACGSNGPKENKGFMDSSLLGSIWLSIVCEIKGNGPKHYRVA